MNLSDYQFVQTKIQNFLAQKNTVIIAIDGRCASGKTTLAARLQNDFSCNVIHMDDFYLPLSLRDANWECLPGKNIDFSKVLDILRSIRQSCSYTFSPYDCHKSDYREPITHSHKPLTIIEGSYSFHPQLQNFYDFSVFLDISGEEQKKRLIARNGEEGYLRFQNLWIPLEEAYFKEHHIRKQCDLIL